MVRANRATPRIVKKHRATRDEREGARNAPSRPTTVGRDMSARWLLFCAFVPAGSGYADIHRESTLCDANETVIFSCASSRAGTAPDHPHSVPRKIISLCATPGVTATSGRLLYRFGADKEHIEISYPEEDRRPDDAFTSDFNSWAKGSSASVTFNRGGYSYTIYNRIAAYSEAERSNGGGVQVRRGDTLASDLWCDGEEHSPAIEDHLWSIVQVLPKTPHAPGQTPRHP